MSQIELIFKF